MRVNGESSRFSALFAEERDRVLVKELSTQRSLTYSTYLGAAFRLAHSFRALGATPGERLLLCADNQLETLVAYLAGVLSGVELVPINPAHPSDEARKLVQMSGARRALCTPGARATPDSLAALQVWELGDESAGLDVAGRPASADAYGALAAVPDTRLTQLMFTSGTTGTPKCVPMHFGRLLHAGRHFVAAHRLERRKFYGVLPLSYLGGWFNLFLIPALSRSTLVLDAPFGPRNMHAFWDVVMAEQISALWFSPPMLGMLGAIGSDDDQLPRKVREQVSHAFVGMAPLTPAQKVEAERRFGLHLLENYGLSETFFIASEVGHRSRAVGTVGRLLPEVEVRFLDDYGAWVERGGEIAVKTPYMMPGYALDGAAADDKVRDGYFCTGDLGTITVDGELSITGRKKDLIIRGGINISPAKIENVLYQHESVGEAAVVGVPDELQGERIVAYVTLNQGFDTSEKELKRFCREKLATFERPGAVRIVDELPKGVSGKVLKRELQRWATA